jgi:hypothetical protein
LSLALKGVGEEEQGYVYEGNMVAQKDVYSETFGMVASSPFPLISQKLFKGNAGLSYLELELSTNSNTS